MAISRNDRGVHNRDHAAVLLEAFHGIHVRVID